MNSLLKIKPIGGLEKIGSNITILEFEKIRVAIDCGLQFFHEDAFNVNYVFPDIDEVEDIDYLIITHGHEDHIGGIFPFISKFPNAKVFAAPFAKELIHKKLSFKNLALEISPLSEIKKIIRELTDFDLEMIPVNHSIPETFGVHLFNDDLSLLFISDFKIDRRPTDEPVFDIDNFSELVKPRKMKLAMLDSTNILVPQRKHEEFDVHENLEKAFGTINKRVYITTFSSNFYRVKKIFKLAEQFNRKIILRGRSIQKYMDIAIKVGFISSEEVDNRILNEKRDKVPENAILLVAGCQGDRKSSLSNLVNSPNSKFSPREGDVFIFSSKTIPGNEGKVNYIVDELYRQGVEVLNDHHGFHTSGHADQRDLFEVYKKYSPTHAIPIHGSVMFLRKHVEFIEKNFPQTSPMFSLNFDEIVISKNLDIKFFKNEQRKQTKLFIGWDEIELDREALSEKRRLAENGVVSLLIKKGRGKSVTSEIETFGINKIDENEKAQLENLISQLDFSGKNFDQDLRALINRFFKDLCGQTPKLLYHLV